MLFNIFFLSSFPLTHELLQNPNLNYLFRTLNLTHTLLNASNPQLAKDCWICLSVTPLGDSALPTSILNWTIGNMSLHHSYHGEPLVISYLKYLHISDQIWNSDILLESGSDGKASVYNAGDLGWIPGLGRCPGEGNGNPLQYSCLENPMDGGA